MEMLISIIMIIISIVHKIITLYTLNREKEMATHSSVLAWRIPGMGEPGRLSSMGLHRVRHFWSDAAAAAHLKYTELLFVYFMSKLEK